MSEPALHQRMGDDTSIRVSETLADELYSRKGRGESYEDVIWDLIERADRADTGEAADAPVPAAEREDIATSSSSASREDDHEAASAPESAPASVDVDQRVRAVVDDVASGWQDSEQRLADRRAAALAVLEHAVETGDAVGKSEAVGGFYADHQVDGQNEETWWRKNVRPVLKAVGDYSQGAHGYVVREEDLGG